MMALLRLLLLKARESPRWLISCGRLSEAVEVVNSISAINKSQYHLTADQFLPTDVDKTEVVTLRENLHRAARLFSGWQNMRLMFGLIIIWALIGIA